MAKKPDQGMKSSAAKRTANATSKKQNREGAPFNNQDAQRRLGNFNGAGEHARQGGRSSGIVGQNKQQNHTDN